MALTELEQRCLDTLQDVRRYLIDRGNVVKNLICDLEAKRDEVETDNKPRVSIHYVHDWCANPVCQICRMRYDIEEAQ